MEKNLPIRILFILFFTSALLSFTTSTGYPYDGDVLINDVNITPELIDVNRDVMLHPSSDLGLSKWTFQRMSNENDVSPEIFSRINDNVAQESLKMDFILVNDGNLVPNASFEEFDVCPPPGINSWGTPRIKDFIRYWQDPPSTATLGPSSDYKHYCSTGYNSNIAAATGSGHMGIFTYYNGGYREYIQTKLKTPLCSGHTYEIKLKLADDLGTDVHTDRIGVYFSADEVESPGITHIDVTPQVTTPAGQFIDNQNNWTEFTMNFTNTGGGEEYITIGNFFSNANTNTQTGSGHKGGYIYIDDISVVDITPAVNISSAAISHATCASSNGSISGITVTGGSGSYSYQWIDTSGNVIATTLDVSNLNPGTYELLVDDGSCVTLSSTSYTIDEIGCYDPCAPGNMVPNPDFEDYKNCPSSSANNGNTLGNQLHDWYSPTSGSTDYINFCDPTNLILGPPDFPDRGYIRMHVWYPGDLREYAQVKLNQPLSAGEVYDVSLEASLTYSSRYEIDRLGIHFSATPVTTGNNQVLPVTAQLETPVNGFIDNKGTWRTFSWTYTATGGEEYLTVGNFRDDTDTNYNDNGNGSGWSLLYIDDVNVISHSSTPSVDAGTDMTINSGQTIALNPSITGATPVSYTWTPATGLDDPTVVNPVFSPPGPGSYIFDLLVDFGGCYEQDTVTITVNDSPVSCTGPNLIPNGDFENPLKCPTESIDNTSDTIGDFLPGWSIPNEASADYYNTCNYSGNDPSVGPANGDGFGGIFLKNGGEYREYFQIELTQTLTAGTTYNIDFNLYRSNTSGWCDFSEVGIYFTDSPVSVSGNQVLPLTPQVTTLPGEFYSNFSWQAVSTVSYTATGNEQYVIIGNFQDNANTNCQNGPPNIQGYYYFDDISIRASSDPSLTVDAGANQTISDTQTAQLQATPSGGTPVSYTWTPATGLNDPNISNPVFTPPSGPGTYSFTVTADFGGGCLSTDQVTVMVNTSCSQIIDAGVDQTIIPGETATLIATPSSGAPTYIWTASPADLSLVGQGNVYNPTVSPTVTTTYTVEADFGGGCVDTDTVVISVNAVNVCKGPNLLPNPSFENPSTCPVFSNSTTINDFYPDWTRPTLTTPDGYHPCGDPELGTPNNYFGFQDPADGNGYAGMYVLSQFGSREYIQTELTTPLASGNTYSVRVRFSQADNTSLAVDQIGIYFSTLEVSTGNNSNLTFTPQLTTPAGTFIEQSDQWETFTWQYTPTQDNLTHIIIGGFGNFNTTQIRPPLSGWGNNAYYYIDDIEISELSVSSTIDAGSDQTINSGGTATLIATPSSGTPTFTWAASPVDPSISGQENLQNPTVSPTQTTTYTVTADFGGVCVDTDTVIVNVNNAFPPPGDFDNDGIANVDDVDDDNDGIFDVIECGEVSMWDTNGSSNGAGNQQAFLESNVGATTITISTAGGDFDGTGDSRFISINERTGGNGTYTINFNEAPVTDLQFYIRDLGRRNSGNGYLGNFSVTLENGTVLNNLNFNILAGTGPFPGAGGGNTEIIQQVNIAGVLYAEDPTANGNGNEAYGLIDFPSILPSVVQSEAITSLSFDIVGDGENSVFIGVLANVSVDTDGDDLLDCYDLDSDNDGCSDANEAYSDPTADGGDGGEYGTGVPPATNPDGSVIAASYPGTNAMVIDANVLTVCTIEDFDNDVVENSDDVDDDNDGIFDIVECGVIRTWDTNGSSAGTGNQQAFLDSDVWATDITLSTVGGQFTGTGDDRYIAISERTSGNGTYTINFDDAPVSDLKLYIRDLGQRNSSNARLGNFTVTLEDGTVL
ncbi:PKD domain-containing protein, partial [Gangjinia marincola]|uniref:PKD domain-containing protein n=1 Tax=Gangjinia marincola TaxID=578463 RepID=UPI0031D8B8C8